MPYKVDGKDYMSIGETAIRWNKSASFVRTRLDAGLIPFATTRAKHGTADPIKVIPIDFPCPEYDPEKKAHIRPKHRVAIEHPAAPKNGFPALHRNADGAVAPAKIDKEAEEVPCADCPHQADKAYKCYGLARYENGETGEGFYGCHRIGRKVHPLKEWTRKSDYAPTPTGVEERKNEVPSVLIAESKPITAPEPEPVETTLPVPEDGNEAVFKEAIIRLEALASEMKAEAEELEARFEHLSEQLSEIIKAKEALERIREYGRREKA